VKARLLAVADQRVTKSGVIVIKAQTANSREQNKVDAMRRLNDLVAQAMYTAPQRRATKPTYGSKQRRLQTKALRGEVKAGRGKVID